MSNKKYSLRPEQAGKSFENAIDFVNRQYDNGQVALIHKIATPIKARKTNGNEITAGKFHKKSTVDYGGVFRGRHICFEAKSTDSKTSFPLSNIKAHQLEHLEKAALHGAICFFLIHFSSYNRTFYVPLEVVRNCLKGSRRSIPYKYFDEYVSEVKGSIRAILDYLPYVEKEMESKLADSV